MTQAWAAASRPITRGDRTYPPPGLILLAAIGGVLLLVVAVNRWATPSDEHAYWLAGQRLLAGEALYDASAVPGTPYAYWYPPAFAQLMAPVSALIPVPAFTAAWTVLLLGCLLWLADRRVLVALALVAFVPVAVELWFRNIHLVLAVLVVLALRTSPLFWIPAIAIKVSPVVGLAYLLAAGRVRDLARVAAVGAVVLAASFAISPDAWRQFLEVVVTRGDTTGSSLVPVPFLLRFAIGVVVAAVAGRVGGRRGEALVTVAIVVANPTLWMTAFSLLVAIVPLARRAGAVR